jgi:hypothetical protein
MYVRLTGGRDRGEAKEFSVEDAKAMIDKGQAVPVNFDEPDPLGKRSDFDVRDAQRQIAEELAIPAPQQTDPALVTAARQIEKPAILGRKRR